MGPRLPLLLGAACLLVGAALGDGSDHRYKLHEEIPLAANKAGPFNNPRCALRLCMHRMRGRQTWSQRFAPRQPFCARTFRFRAINDGV